MPLVSALSGAGIALLLCSCATSSDEKEKGELPLVQALEKAGETPVQPSNPISQKDPFRSPDVTRSLPGSSPSTRPSAKPLILQNPEPAPLSKPAPNPTPLDTEE
jgi:hypothetical protein